jgi:hypothetical protein
MENKKRDSIKISSCNDSDSEHAKGKLPPFLLQPIEEPQTETIYEWLINGSHDVLFITLAGKQLNL